MCSVREPRSLLRELFAQFIRTDVLLACVRECVKNVHATHTLLQTPPTQTWVPRIRVRVSFVCAPTSLHFNPINQSRDSFTLHIIGGPPRGVLQAVFPAVHSGMPVPHIRVVDTLFDSLQRGTLTHTDIRTLWWGYPTQRPPSKDPPRLSCFWRRRLLAFSLFFCRRVPSHSASMLLTLDHWTKIDSTAAAAAAAFQLFLFYPLFHTIPHSLYQFAFTYFFTLLHSPIIASLLKLLLVPLALSPGYTAHSFWHLCTLLFLLLHHTTTTSTVTSSCSFSLGLSSGQSTIRLAPPAAAARRRPDRFPCRMFHETFALPRAGEIDLSQRPARFTQSGLV